MVMPGRREMKIDVPEWIKDIAPYKPGKPVEELARESGVADAVKLASNENPLGPSPAALNAVKQALSSIHRYPDGRGYELTMKISRHLGVSPEMIVLGNGSDELIGMLARAFLVPGDRAVMTEPAFLMYEIMTKAAGAVPVKVPLKQMAVDFDGMLSAIDDRTKILFLNNPLNPTGHAFSKRDFESFLESVPEEVVVVLDEAYIEFVRDPECARGLDFCTQDRMVVVLRTFSKAYGLAGVRVGYGVMPEEIAGILHKVRQPFNVNSLAQAAACAALDDIGFMEKTVSHVQGEIDYLKKRLDQLGIRHYPTQANFFLVDTGRDADEVFEEMLAYGVIVRSMASYGFPGCIRINAGTRDENNRFLDAAFKVIAGRKGEY